MNEVTLKKRAAKLTKKINSLGFKKDGKVMVIDQAYELIAAEEGFRNQHALRAKLIKSGDEPVAPANVEYPSFAWDRLLVSQGWDDRSQIGLFEEFLTDNNLMGKFVQYATERADLEGTGDVLADELIDVLKLMGISVNISDFGKPYWECSHPDSDYNGMCSVDFESEQVAWQDAWLHVQVESNDGAKFAADSARAGNPEPLARWMECKRAEFATTAVEAVADLESQWEHEHPHYTRADWQADVADDNTRLGYWEWAHHNIEGHGGEDAHCTKCGCPDADNGEGFDGLCGNCADEADPHLEAEVSELSAVQLAQARVDAANDAYENFDFGANVVDDNGWEWSSGTDTCRRTVFLDDGTGSDSVAVTYVVQFEEFTVSTSYCIK